MSIRLFSSEDLDELELKAAESPRFRKHWNIHSSYEDPCQRFFNAILCNSYLRPHRHSEIQGEEALFAIRGLMALVTFHENGAVEEVLYFGDALHAKSKAVLVGVEVPPGKWHTVISLDSVSVLLEVKAGPFDSASPKFPAPWAPEEGGELAASYFKALCEMIALKKPV